MISVLLWKEYRTQRMAWVALALLGAAALLGLPFVWASQGPDTQETTRRSLLFMAVALAWTYGLVCGALLLAGEREARTLTFLDTLPGLRRQLWTAKLLAGLALLAAQIAVLAILAAAARLFTDGSQVAWMLFGMTCAGLYGLGWGMLFSAFGRGVLNMILLAMAAQLAAVFLASFLNLVITGILIRVFSLAPEAGEAMGIAVAGLLGLLTVPPVLAVSAARFTRLDRNRLQAAESLLVPRTGAAHRVRVACSRLFWLAGRQSRGFAAGMAVFALLLGLVVLAWGVVLWPLTTLLVGVLCGATAFADEQQGPFRFLGDQRLPLSLLWVVKVGLHFAIAAAAALLVLAPSFVVALARMPDTWEESNRAYPFLSHLFNSRLVGTVCPTGLFLTLWLVAGFCAGCLCGLLFRHGLASGLLALFLGSVLTAVWIPSMLEGGLQAWQVFGAPLLLLTSTLPLLRPWAAGRIASWATAKRLAPFALLAVLWVAGGVWYRITEILDVAPPHGLAEFEADLPQPDHNKAGDLVRGACLRFRELAQNLQAKEAARPDPALGPAAPPDPAAVGEESYFNRASEAAYKGWPAGDAKLAAWLDKLFQGDWLASLKEAADLPPDTVENLRQFTFNDSDRLSQPAMEIGVMLAARGLQRQAAGDDETYVEELRLGLTLARALRHHAPREEAMIGSSVAHHLLWGLVPWLEHLNGRPDLLRRALGLLSDYLDAEPADEADQTLVDYLIARNSLSYPTPWVQEYLAQSEGRPVAGEESLRREAQWIGLAGLLTPWEHERQERLLRFLLANPHWMSGPEAGPVAVLRPSPYYVQFTPSRKCLERFTLLVLALRLYQAETGRPAQSLDELVPKYVSAIPLDPYDGQPIRYRLSAGEQIEWPEEPPPPGAPAAPAPSIRDVPPGQGILWCTGPDRRDDGGKQQEGSMVGPGVSGTDEILLVPLPPGSK